MLEQTTEPVSQRQETAAISDRVYSQIDKLWTVLGTGLGTCRWMYASICNVHVHITQFNYASQFYSLIFSSAMANQTVLPITGQLPTRYTNMTCFLLGKNIESVNCNFSNCSAFKINGWPNPHACAHKHLWLASAALTEKRDKMHSLKAPGHPYLWPHQD